MKQTAVEWLEDCFNRYGAVLKSDFIKAKEMEKQQQGYSEEELKSAFKIGFNIGYGSPVQELDLKN